MVFIKTKAESSLRLFGTVTMNSLNSFLEEKKVD